MVKVFTNPDNYAWYAMATYVQGKLGEYPQRPLAPKELPPSPLAPLMGSVNASLTNISEEDLNALAAAMSAGSF